MIKKFKLSIFFLTFILTSKDINCRSINRPHDPFNARLETNWVGDKKNIVSKVMNLKTVLFSKI